MFCNCCWYLLILKIISVWKVDSFSCITLFVKPIELCALCGFLQMYPCLRRGTIDGGCFKTSIWNDGTNSNFQILLITVFTKFSGYFNPNLIHKSSALNCYFLLGFVPLWNSWEKLCEIQKCAF